MGSGIKLVVSMALAVLAMAAAAPSAEAPQVEYKNPGYPGYVAGHKKFFPDPTMGIRG
jgi:hypothetical protein